MSLPSDKSDKPQHNKFDNYYFRSPNDFNNDLRLDFGPSVVNTYNPVYMSQFGPDYLGVPSIIPDF